MKVFALATGLALGISAMASAQTVRVGMAPEPYPPFASVDAAGTWTGWEVEMMEAVCKAAALDCVIAPTAWDGIIPALTSGQIDAIMNSMSINEERLKVVDFSDKYYNTPSVIVAAKDSGITADAAGLTGKIIGVQVATIHQAYVEKHFGSVAAEVKAYQTQDEANQDLVAGRVDAIQADSIALDSFLVSAEGQACCATMGAVADDPAVLGLGVGVALRKDDAALKEAFNKGIAAVLADGTYETITAKYFTSSIYGE